ncbi:MAG: Uma2 family endonuclease [Hyphomicrobiales bacterium]|nr:Uma2 family endonuclease [Hyphomicrobiales bacterium]MDE2016362.1 Uma2 family endonuclease [Hyphomicrobiales bacterium]
MSGIASPKVLIGADAYLESYEGRDGKWELHDGAPVAMSPERMAHVRTKYSAHAALASSKAPCEALGEGVAVRIGPATVYEPDALVNRGERLDGDALEASNPVIVVEVLSPSTASLDHGRKLRDYFSRPSVAHYLILDPDARTAIHHARGRGDLFPSE